MYVAGVRLRREKSDGVVLRGKLPIAPIAGVKPARINFSEFSSKCR
jgi:hypothetical protein